MIRILEVLILRIYPVKNNIYWYVFFMFFNHLRNTIPFDLRMIFIPEAGRIPEIYYLNL